MFCTATAALWDRFYATPLQEGGCYMTSTTIDPDTFVKSFLAQARENQIAMVVIFSYFLDPKGKKARRSVATNLPDAGAQALTGHLIKTDGAAVEAAAREMLRQLGGTTKDIPAFETLPDDMRAQLIAGAQEILTAAANSGARKPPSGIVPADG